jgi:hypothetical protein
MKLDWFFEGFFLNNRIQQFFDFDFSQSTGWNWWFIDSEKFNKSRAMVTRKSNAHPIVGQWTCWAGIRFLLGISNFYFSNISY